MRVLITSSGNKWRLVKAFKDAGADVLVHDINLLAPTMLENENYVGQKVDLIVPTRDAELKMHLGMPEAVVSSEYTLHHTLDKMEFYLFCRRHGFQTPRTWQMNAYVKPRKGSGSRGIMKVSTASIIQEECVFPEVSIDYFADFNGRTLSCIPRYRKDVVNGESQACELLPDANLILEANRMGQELGIIGPATMQGYWTGSTFIWGEVNPRFGGGSHFTWNIFNSPKWLVTNYGLLREVQQKTKSEL